MPWALGMFVIFWEICQTALYSVSFTPFSLCFAFTSVAVSSHIETTGVRLKSGYISIGLGNKPQGS